MRELTMFLEVGVTGKYGTRYAHFANLPKNIAASIITPMSPRSSDRWTIAKQKIIAMAPLCGNK